jgi:hypothetical protein
MERAMPAVIERRWCAARSRERGAENIQMDEVAPLLRPNLRKKGDACRLNHIVISYLGEPHQIGRVRSFGDVPALRDHRERGGAHRSAEELN